METTNKIIFLILLSKKSILLLPNYVLQLIMVPIF